MDRKEAIELIKRHIIINQIGKYPHIKLGEALSLAIEALQEPQVGGWIPVTERLPENGCGVLVTITVMMSGFLITAISLEQFVLM